MTRAEELLSIRAFASVTRLSLKALQLYDQLNLTTTLVRPQSGYRYYGEDQVKQLAGGQATCVMTVDPETDFPVILGAYDAGADWIQKNGHEMAEPPREIWHSRLGGNVEPKM